MLDKIQLIWSRYSGLYLGQGLIYTLSLSLIAVLLGSIIGTLIAMLKMSRFKPLGWIATAYVEVIRGTPMLLQLYLFVFLLPYDFVWGLFGWLYSSLGWVSGIFGHELGMTTNEFYKFMCVAVALFINSSAYVSEVIRSGIQAVDRGQTEAARSLGLGKGQTMIKIVLPQAIKNILPALGNEFVTITKDTSLASTFFIGDLMTVYNIVRGKTYLVIEPMIIVAIIYFVISFTLSKAIAAWERKLKKGD